MKDMSQLMGTVFGNARSMVVAKLTSILQTLCCLAQQSSPVPGLQRSRTQRTVKSGHYMTEKANLLKCRACDKLVPIAESIFILLKYSFSPSNFGLYFIKLSNHSIRTFNLVQIILNLYIQSLAIGNH